MHRDKFHLPRPHYFLSHSVGAQPKTYKAAIEAGYERPWREDGFDVWGPWFEALDRFKSGLATIIGARPDEICPLTNVSSGIAKILFSLPERPRRRKIVLTEDDFPTVGFALGAAERFGYELEFIPGGERLADIDAWSRAFADDVQLVSATLVYSNSSVMIPAENIARRARDAGVITIFDIAQASGTVPVALNDWNADFAVGTSLKYLCGGAGAAFLWASESAAKLARPIDIGWFSHADPFEFDIHNFEYAPGAARFTGGTPSIAPFAGAAAAHEIINKIGVNEIYARNQRLLDRLFDALPEDAFLSMQEAGKRGSAALIKVRDYDAAAKDLAEAGVAHDTRKGAVRISIHLYNDENDIDALVDAIKTHL